MMPEQDSAMTLYVTTRWYRAPEILMGGKDYDEKIDVWAVGCILAEILLRKPFMPGRSHGDQLKLIFQTLGTPSPEVLTRMIKSERVCQAFHMYFIFR